MAIILSSSGLRPINLQRRQQEDGFTLLEMVVAMFILTIGLLGVASAIGYALMASNSGRGLTNAKLLVVSSLEQMETLRDSGQLNFAEIDNAQVLGSSFTGFLTGFQPVSLTPGPDFVYGTADDPGISNPAQAVNGVTRKIEIIQLSPTLKQIKVTLKYLPDPSGSASKRFDLVCSSFLNDDSHGNYVP